MTAPPDEFPEHECSVCGTDCVAVGEMLDNNARRIATLTAENKALRSALRCAVLERQPGQGLRCAMCRYEWMGHAERHATGCLAAGAANER